MELQNSVPVPVQIEVGSICKHHLEAENGALVGQQQRINLFWQKKDAFDNWFKGQIEMTLLSTRQRFHRFSSWQ